MNHPDQDSYETVTLTPSQALERLDQLGEQIASGKNTFAGLWADLKTEIGAFYFDFFDDSETDAGGEERGARHVRDVVRGLHVAKKFRKLEKALMMEKWPQGNQDAQALLLRARKLLNDVKTMYLPAWVFGRGVSYSKVTDGNPNPWFKEPPLMLFGYDVWEKAFIHRGRQPFNAEEYRFLVNYLIEHCRKEGEHASFAYFCRHIAPIFFGTSESQIREFLSYPLQQGKLQAKHEDSAFIKGLSNFCRQTFEILKDPNDERHTAARELIAMLPEVSAGKVSQQYWRDAIAQGLSNRELDNEKLGIIDFCNTLLDIAEETGDTWYKELADDFIATVQQFEIGPELFFDSSLSRVRIPDQPAEELEKTLQARQEEFTALFKRTYSHDVPLDEKKVLETLTMHLQSDNRALGCRFYLDMNSQAFSNSFFYELPDKKRRRISYIIEPSEDGTLQVSADFIFSETEEEGKKFQDLKRALMAVSIDILQLGIASRQEKLKTLNQTTQTLASAKEQKQPQPLPTSSKRKWEVKQSPTSDVVPPELQEQSKFNALRPKMILPDEVLQQLPANMTVEYLRGKIDLYNQGALSLRKIADRHTKEGFSIFRLKLQKYRVIAEMRADGQLYVTSVSIREKDTYKN